MTQPSSTDTRSTDPDNHHSRLSTPLRIVGMTILVSLVAVEPALAQTNAVCDAEKLPSMISGFFQLTTTIGLVGLVIVWQANSLAEMFTLSPDQREGLKRHKRTALKSTVILLALGPLYTVAGSTMDLPLADCINLAPW